MPYCNTFAVKKASVPAHLDRAKEFNVHVQADVLWLDLDTLEDFQEKGKKKNRKVGILVMVDEATRYMMARTIPHDQAQRVQVFTKEHSLRDLAGLRDALNWVVPALSQRLHANSACVGPTAKSSWTAVR